MSVIVSSGYRNFHMTSSAAEASARGNLIALICGSYPRDTMYRAAALAQRLGIRKAGKLIGRRVAVRDSLVHPQPFCEWLSMISQLSETKFRGWGSEPILRRSLACYASSSSKLLNQHRSAAVYHFRAGFGGSSVQVARSLGMKTICDHSIVHPKLLDFMVEHEGRFPDAPPEPHLSVIWQHVLADMDAADRILVNSNLVMESCRFMGIPEEKLRVIYLGVDEAFFATLPKRRAYGTSTKRLLFAGHFGYRKGADTLLDALPLLEATGWELRVAGVISPELEGPLRKALAHLPIHRLGNLTRAQLAAEMSATDIFVFPSLAEGSARVVFEALAAGCAVVTTPNAGSIVEDGKQGRIIAPGDAAALARALGELVARDDLEAIGAANAQLIRSRYRQRDYGDALDRLYRDVTVDG